MRRRAQAFGGVLHGARTVFDGLLDALHRILGIAIGVEARRFVVKSRRHLVATRGFHGTAPGSTQRSIRGRFRLQHRADDTAIDTLRRAVDSRGVGRTQKNNLISDLLRRGKTLQQRVTGLGFKVVARHLLH